MHPVRMPRPPFRKNSQRTPAALIASVCGIAGCATHTHIALEYPKPAAWNGGVTVSIIDQRGRRERGYDTGQDEHCSRLYGDDFLIPAKTTYLQHALEAKAPAGASIQLTLSHFETIEYCDATEAREVAAAVGGVTGGKVVFPDASKGARGDWFKLHISGTVNGKSFDISEQFDENDMPVGGSRANTPEFQKRLQKAADAAIDQLLSVAASAS
jgi:hypothetical protein